MAPVAGTAKASRFLISGASGMLGTALTRELDLHEVSTVRLVRRNPGPGDVLWQPASARPFESPHILEGFDAAIHLSGASVASHRWTADFQQEMRSSRVDSTRALATALAELKNPPRVLLVASAIGIYGERGEEELDESSAPGSGILPRLCEEWEAAAAPARAAGIRVVHLRFGVVLGPGAGALGQMLPVFRLGLGGRLGSGRQWMSWIGLPDTIAACLYAAEHPTLDGPVNVVAPQPVRNVEFTKRLGAALHRPALLPAPAWALRAAFGPMADEALLASARVLPRKLEESGFVFREPTLAQALASALR